MSDLREAARAAVHLTKQLRAVLVVGEALEKIDNLENMRDEAIRLQGEEAAKLLEIKEKIADAEDKLEVIDADKERSLEDKRNADVEVRAKLTQADADAQEILNAAERAANAKLEEYQAAFIAQQDEYEVALGYAKAKLDETTRRVEDAEAKLKSVADQRAEIVASLS